MMRTPCFLTPEDVAYTRTPRATVRLISKEVSRLTGIPASEIMGPRRSADVCRARELVCYVARRNGMSYPQIGRALKRDHSTIIHAISNECVRRGEL